MTKKYIDAEKLKTYLEEEAEKEAKKIDYSKTEPELLFHRGCRAMAFDVSHFIDSLQQEQPEVELGKDDIIDYVHSHFYYDKDFDGYGHSNLRPVFTRDDIEVIARHFYELGLNAKK